MKFTFSRKLLIFAFSTALQPGFTQISFDKKLHTALDPGWATTFKTYRLNDAHLWCVGSAGAYSRLEGNSWVKDQLPNTSVSNRGIALDNHGTLWVGTFGDGLFKKEGSTWTQLVQSNSILPSEYIPSMLFDTIRQELWIATYGGLVRKKEDTWQLYTADNSQLVDDVVTGIQQSGDGAIWVVNGHGVTRIYDGIWSTFTSDQIFGGVQNDLGDIFIDASQRVWITSGYSLDGVAYLDGGGWHVLPGFAGKNIQSVGVNGTGTVFLGELFEGMHVVSGGVNYFFPASTTGFPTGQNFDFTLDANGNTLWMCNTWGLWEIRSATVATEAPDALANGISAFPVPASDRVSIGSDHSTIQSVQVFNAAGALVETLKFDRENKVDIPVDRLPAGIYFLQTTLADNSVSVIRIAVDPR